ncbi:hypothetical protein [Polaribacter cellanae]|uniref:Uncharacterized protein n=1 Tax=Polaribacter cellanae TaxID=2818493 RepID=A0A975H890_9FLAO|nr:hypothetical protein [Polaribacter cellanae]QTE24316.1 hypothetical protein J3359_08665 [Polaribacter cellanae]
MITLDGFFSVMGNTGYSRKGAKTQSFSQRFAMLSMNLYRKKETDLKVNC